MKSFALACNPRLLSVSVPTQMTKSHATTLTNSIVG